MVGDVLARTTYADGANAENRRMIECRRYLAEPDRSWLYYAEISTYVE